MSPRPLLLGVTLLLGVLTTPYADAAYELDNALLNQPSISCHPDTIEMRFRTKRPFTGKIYVQGHYSNPDCRVDFGQAGGADHDGRGGIRLHHGSCNMDRQRMLSDQGQGMQFSTVLVISFHPLFVTKTDRAFHINCLYREDDKNVAAEMSVGDVTPGTLHNDMPVPHCTYTIRKDELNGEVLKFARVGDLIVHRWECDTELYGMLVHSCYVEDGQGDRVQVVDERGCHKDQNVLGDPTYTEALNMAYRESYVFKFRDRVGVRFSCEIKLCVKADDGCAEITPPDCQRRGGGTHFQHQRDDHPTSAANHSSSTAHANRHRRSGGSALSPRTVDADLISQYVFVLDEPVEGETDADIADQGPARGALSTAANTTVCISSALFAAIAVLLLATFGLASAVVGHALCKQYRSRSSAVRHLSACSVPSSSSRSPSCSASPLPARSVPVPHSLFFKR